jgi:lysophospholipase L1-like esterase
MKKRIFAALCGLALLVCAFGCAVALPEGSSADETKKPDANEAQTLERAREEYLSSVTYRKFVLTGESEPYYIGRWFDKDIGGIPHKVTLTDGAYLCFMTEGATALDVSFTVITTGETPYFAYSVDGGRPVRQRITESTVTLPDAGRHTVRIVADGMTEGEGKWEREKGFALRCVTPSEGGRIVGIRPTEKTVFFYGDSITEGVRALNMSATSKGNSATNAYSWQCAEKLGVTPYLIGYGATGILCKGSFHTMRNAIDYLSEGRPVSDGVVPDLIVVNHGTNDGRYGAEEFGEALAGTLARLREKYPDAPIVYLVPFCGAHAQTVSAVVGEMENAYVIPTELWDIPCTDSLHPSAEGAEKAGALLAEALTDLFGEEYFKS